MGLSMSNETTIVHPNVVAATAIDETVSVTDVDAALEFTHHIIDTHFSTFSYNDARLQALLTISSLFLAGVTFIMTSFDMQSAMSLWLAAASAFLLVISILLCVWHVTPKMNAGIGNEINPRSAIGTSNKSKKDYERIIYKLTKEDMLRHNCNQISGLSRINTKSAIVLKISAVSIGLAVVVFVAAVTVSGLPERKKTDQQEGFSFIRIIIGKGEPSIK